MRFLLLVLSAFSFVPSVTDAKRLKTLAKVEIIVPDGPLVCGHTYSMTFPKGWKVYATFNGRPLEPADDPNSLMFHVATKGTLKIYKIDGGKDTVLIKEQHVYGRNPEFFVRIGGAKSGEMINKAVLGDNAEISVEIINNDISLPPFPIIGYEVRYYKDGKLLSKKVKGGEIPTSLLSEISSLSNTVLVFFIQIDEHGSNVSVPPVPIFI